MILAMISVEGVRALPVLVKPIPKGINGARVQFEYNDPMWDGLSKTVVFQAGDVTKDVLNAGELVDIPPEVVAEVGEILKVGVYGEGIPTLWADLGRIRDATDPSGDESTDPSLPVWAQLQEQIDDLKENGSPGGGGSGENGGYYTPSVKQPDKKTLQFSFAPSKANMPAINPVEVELPAGPNGDDYKLTDADKKEIAEMAADLVEIPDSGGNADYVLPVGGDELGGVKNGGNVVINPDGTMTVKIGDDVEYETTEYTKADNYSQMAINTSGETADISALVGDISWRHMIVWCEADTTVYVTGQGGTSYRAWALVAKDGRVLSASESRALCENVRINITSACYVVVNCDYTIAGSLTVVSPKKEESAVEARLVTDKFISVSDWKVGRIKTNGDVGTVVDYTVDETATNYRWQIIDCYTGMSIKVGGHGGDAGRLWCFVNGDDTIMSVAKAYASGTTLTAPVDGKCIFNAEVLVNTPMSVEYTPYSLKPVMDTVCENKENIRSIQDAMSGKVPFGIGINCKYTVPDIDALNLPEAGSRLSYFYGLYDGLLADYPEYISKVDCDAVAVEAGIERPEYMNNSPIYLYKFIPAYTSKTNAMDGVTAQRSKIKVFITTGTHPEYMAIWDMYHTMRLVCEGWESDDNLEALRWDCEIYIMPCSGAYSVNSGSRTNYNGVDLNRNAPTSNWTLTTEGTNTYSGPSAGSEYETKVFAHFMELLAPDVYIDHHNTDPTGDPGIAIYGTAQQQDEIDILSEHISVMSRRWKKRFPNVFPQDNTTIVGYASTWGATGSRDGYGAEHVSRSFTYESQTTLLWDNGEIVSGAHKNDTVACTCATDGFINFLLRMLKTTW